LVELVKIEQQVRWLSDAVDDAPCPDPDADMPTPSPAPQRSPSATPPSPLVVTGRGLPDPDTGRKAQTTEKPTTTTTTGTAVAANPRVLTDTVDPDAVLSQNPEKTLSETGETGGDSTIKKPQDG